MTSVIDATSIPLAIKSVVIKMLTSWLLNCFSILERIDVLLFVELIKAIFKLIESFEISWLTIQLI